MPQILDINILWLIPAIMLGINIGVRIAAILTNPKP